LNYPTGKGRKETDTSRLPSLLHFLKFHQLLLDQIGLVATAALVDVGNIRREASLAPVY